MAVRIITHFVFVPLGLVFAALGVPLIRRKVPPNSAYGFRVRRTLSDPKVWYDANEFSGRCLSALGAVMSVAALVLFFIPAIGDISYFWMCQFITLAGLAVSVFITYRYLNSISSQQD